MWSDSSLRPVRQAYSLIREGGVGSCQPDWVFSVLLLGHLVRDEVGGVWVPAQGRRPELAVPRLSVALASRPSLLDAWSRGCALIRAYGLIRAHGLGQSYSLGREGLKSLEDLRRAFIPHSRLRKSFYASKSSET